MFSFSKSAEAFSFYGRSSNTSRPRGISQGEKEAPPLPFPSERVDLPAASLEPSIDAPPSRQRIRAYTEQMKRSSAYSSQHSRTPTSSSTNSSLRRGSASTESGEHGSLSRQSSVRSSVSGMAPKAERRESIQILGKTLFPRGAPTKKSNKPEESSLKSPSSVSVQSASTNDKQSAKEHYYARSKSLRRPRFVNSMDDMKKHQISGPYNFQHVTHTRQDHLPDLAQTSRTDLASEFTALTSSQAPTHGELKGIRATKLELENLSPESIKTKSPPIPPEISPKRTPTRSRMLMMSSTKSVRRRPLLPHVRSQENIRTTPPPRPYRDPACPLELPPRTSSRTASMIWDEYDPLMTTTLDRPRTSAGFRHPKAFHLPISQPMPLVPTEDFQQEIVPNQPAVEKTTEIEAWPLPSPDFDVTPSLPLLPDVPEEDEYFSKRKSRSSIMSSDLRSTKSVPNLRSARQSMIKVFPEAADDRPRTPQSSTTVRAEFGTIDGAEIGIAVSPTKPAINVTSESWEDDIDYCYEHELEAKCDYDWDRESVKGSEPPSTGAPNLVLPSQHNFAKPLTQPKILTPSSHAVSRAPHSQPPRTTQPASSLLTVPPPLDLPELSPMSNGSLDSPELRTPNVLVRPTHLRTNSHASSFKESHGFNLSPSLLIPKDFSAQIEHEDLYYEELMHHDHDQDPSLHLHNQAQYDPYPLSPVDGPSGSASFRSSGFSRSSNGASLSKKDSHESVVLLSRAASVVLEHRSMSSVGSLPDLILSKRSNPDMSGSDFNPRSPLNTSFEDLSSTATSSFSSIHPDDMRTAETTPTGYLENLTLNPVSESLDQSDLAHRRKHSAPLQRVSERQKGRQRSATTTHRPKSSRGSNYMLFPQAV